MFVYFIFHYMFVWIWVNKNYLVKNVYKGFFQKTRLGFLKVFSLRNKIMHAPYQKIRLQASIYDPYLFKNKPFHCYVLHSGTDTY